MRLLVGIGLDTLPFSVVELVDEALGLAIAVYVFVCVPKKVGWGKPWFFRSRENFS